MGNLQYQILSILSHEKDNDGWLGYSRLVAAIRQKQPTQTHGAIARALDRLVELGEVEKMESDRRTHTRLDGRVYVRKPRSRNVWAFRKRRTKCGLIK